MTTSDRFSFEPLSTAHDRTEFSCGIPSLDSYLQQQAGQDIRRRLAAVFVLHDQQTATIAGYYTLSATSIVPEDLPASITRRLPRYPHLPAILLGRLAVATAHQGQGCGKLLLIDALRRCLDTRTIAAMAVVVDALDDVARSFYERYGFSRFAHDGYRLYLPMETIGRM